MRIQSFTLAADQNRPLRRLVRRTVAVALATALLTLSAAAAVEAAEPKSSERQVASDGFFDSQRARVTSTERLQELQRLSPKLLQDLKVVKELQALHTVIAQKSIVADSTQLAAGDACEIAVSGRIHRVDSTSVSEAEPILVEYHQGQVFLVDRTLLDLWSVLRTAGLGYFCPSGTQFFVSQEDFERFETRGMVIAETKAMNVAEASADDRLQLELTLSRERESATQLLAELPADSSRAISRQLGTSR